MLAGAEPPPCRRLSPGDIRQLASVSDMTQDGILVQGRRVVPQAFLTSCQSWGLASLALALAPDNASTLGLGPILRL